MKKKKKMKKEKSPPRYAPPPPQRRPRQRADSSPAKVPGVCHSPSPSIPSPSPSSSSSSFDVPPRADDVLQQEGRAERKRGHGHDPPQQHRRRRPEQAAERDDAVDGGARSQGPRRRSHARPPVLLRHVFVRIAGPDRRGAVRERSARAGGEVQSQQGSPSERPADAFTEKIKRDHVDEKVRGPFPVRERRRDQSVDSTLGERRRRDDEVPPGEGRVRGNVPEAVDADVGRDEPDEDGVGVAVIGGASCASASSVSTEEEALEERLPPREVEVRAAERKCC